MNTLTTIDAFHQLDVRVGTIIDVADFPEARNPAFQLLIDFGPLGLKKSSAQITQRYTKETLLNRQIIATVNLPPRQIAHFLSECLVLGILGTNKDVILLKPDQPVANGMKIG